MNVEISLGEIIICVLILGSFYFILKSIQKRKNSLNKIRNQQEQPNPLNVKPESRKLVRLTFDNKAIPFNELSQQHISNIYWFQSIFFPQSMKQTSSSNPYSLKKCLFDELDSRFNGQLLPYRPVVRFEEEIRMLKERGMLKPKSITIDNIVKSYDIVFEGQIIGELIVMPEYCSV